MFCPICGCPLKADDFFCPRCGSRVSEKPVDLKEANLNDETVPAVIPNENTEASLVAENAVKAEKEPVLFGLGAVLACGAVILVLAVLCGVFGGLYFSEKSKNAAFITNSAVSVQSENG